LILYLVRVHRRAVEDPDCRLSPELAEVLDGILADGAKQETEQLRDRLTAQLLTVSHLLITAPVRDNPLLNPVLCRRVRKGPPFLR
jgi:hypothetical protein